MMTSDEILQGVTILQKVYPDHKWKPDFNDPIVLDVFFKVFGKYESDYFREACVQAIRNLDEFPAIAYLVREIEMKQVIGTAIPIKRDAGGRGHPHP